MLIMDSRMYELLLRAGAAAKESAKHGKSIYDGLPKAFTPKEDESKTESPKVRSQR
jgi:hypothetical protein